MGRPRKHIEIPPVTIEVDRRRLNAVAAVSDEDVQQRIEIVLSLILEARSRTYIIVHCKSLGWDVVAGTIDVYISKAKQAIVRHYESQLPTLLQETAKQYDMLYSQALKAGDHRAAAKILQMRYEMIAGKPIQETRELSRQEAPQLTTVMIIDGKEKRIDLRIDKKTELLPESGGVGEGL
jgi:hypothetical protein